MSRTGMNPAMLRSSARLGFTLIEMTAATVCTGVVVAGLASCLMIAGHVFDEDRTTLTAQTRVAEPLDCVLSELRYATAFTERTATAVTFKVPDRNGDSLAETIRYSWSGTAGDPLMMTYNGSAASILVPKVQAFNLGYRLRTFTGTGFAQGVVSAEEVLVGSHDDAPGGRFTALGIMPSQWQALYLEPNLPSGTANWDLTLVRLSMRQSSNPDGTFTIQIRPVVGVFPSVRPSDTVLAEITNHESMLARQYAWYDFPLSASGLTPGQPIFVVIKHGGIGTVTAELEREINIPDQPGYAIYQTQDSGSTWTLLNGELRSFVYGIAN